MNSYTLATIGGIIIGLAAAGMLWTNGRVLGVSGILGGLLPAKNWDLVWRFAFILGMIAGSTLIHPLGFSVMAIPVDRSLVAIGVGGLLVGFGTTISNGCTSGHGVCGVSRLSPRSIVATLLFMAAGIATVAVIRFAFGGGI